MYPSFNKETTLSIYKQYKIYDTAGFLESTFFFASKEKNNNLDIFKA